MIDFERFTLDNGLTVIVNEDKSSPFVAFNLLYNVGSKDESEHRTGFAHLFEHLMFEGSVNVPNFDDPLQRVGGENNAFTNTDITNYYITLPKENLETAFWLESDRMLGLNFSEEKLRIQKNVVIEEFKQRYLNKPYGDFWLMARPLVYKEHPYKWATIGKEIGHIENATLDEVKDFFYSHYAPNNAILAISGNVTVEEIKQLTEKWFGPIPTREIAKREYNLEPVQNQMRRLTVERKVPVDNLYLLYPMCGRNGDDFYATDLISDILSNGKSSRLYQSLYKEKKLFSEINAFITGEMDSGLFVVSGALSKGVSVEAAERGIEEEMMKLKEGFIFNHEMLKVKNKIESTIKFSETSILNKAMSLSKAELICDAGLLNREVGYYTDVEINDIKRISEQLFRNSNKSAIYYKAQQ